MLNDSFKLRRGCRVSCCCLSKRSRVWRWIRYLLRRNATVRKCWSRTKGKEEDVIHKSGWKLIWKQEKSVGLLTDRLCLVDQVSQKKVLLEERNSRCTLPSRVCLNVSLCYRSTFWLPWSRIPGITIYLPSEAKPKPNTHDYKATNSFWINYWALSSVGRGTTGSQSPRGTASFSGDSVHGSPPDTLTTGSRPIFSLNRHRDWWKSCL